MDTCRAKSGFYSLAFLVGMRSVERRFLDLQHKRPLHSSLVNLEAAIRGQGFSAGMIGRWFNKLVEKGDYESRDKRAILKHLVALSCPEESKKQPLNASVRGEKALT